MAPNAPDTCTARVLLGVWLLAGSWVGAQPAERQPSTRDSRLAAPLSLTDCIRIAMQDNLDLRIARTELEATQTGVGEALGGFFPELRVTGERTKLTHDGEVPNFDEHLRVGAAGLSQKSPLGTQLDLSYTVTHNVLHPDRTDTPERYWEFNLTQPLLRGAGWQTGTSDIQVARYETRMAQAALASAEFAIVEQVKAAYYEVIRQAKLIDVNQKAVERDHQLLLQSQGKLEAGVATRRDVLSAEIAREQDRGRLVDAETAHEEALDVLAQVLGLNVGAGIAIAQKDVDLDPVHADESAWITKALRDNPDLLVARLQLDRDRLARQVAGNSRLPQLDLSVLYREFDDPDLNEPVKEENIERALRRDEPKEFEATAFRGWTSFLSFSYPIGNKSLGNAYKRARLVYEQSQRNLLDLERRVARDIRSANRNLENNLKRLEILNKNIEGASNKLEFASVNFQLGRASNLDITEAQKDLLEAETDYINEVIDYRLQLAKIERLVAGFE